MEATCSTCGRPIAGSDVLYSPEGATLCPACSAGRELLDADKRAAANIKGSAWGAFALSILSLFFNPFFFVTIAAVSSGVYAIKSLQPDNERFAKHVAGSRISIMFAAIAGIVIAIGIVGLRVLGVTASVVR